MRHPREILRPIIDLDMESSFTQVLAFPIAISVLTFAYVAWQRRRSIPLVNGRRWMEFSLTNAKKRFRDNAGEIIWQQLKKYPGMPFRVIADVGEMVILPPELAPEIRNHQDFSFTMAAYKVCGRSRSARSTVLKTASGFTLICLALKGFEREQTRVRL